MLLRTAGQSCGGGGDFQFDGTCNPGLDCKNDGTSECGTCAFPALPGQACTTGSQCTTGMCNSAVCAAYPGLNEPCMGSCAGNLNCRAGTCQFPLPEGAACGEGSCVGGLTCVGPSASRTCQALKAAGQQCSPAASEAHCRLLCVPSSTSSTSGTCSDAPTLPTVDQPCAWVGLSPVCAFGLWPRVTGTAAAPTGCTCSSRKANSATCDSGNECDSGVCDNSVCAAPFADGLTCGGDSQCQSGNCEYNMVSQQSECAAAVMCF